jgi:hypothetical protein
MQRLPSKKILPRSESGSSARQEIRIPHKATYRKTRIGRYQRQDFARAIIRTLAWDVDFAAARNTIGN